MKVSATIMLTACLAVDAFAPNTLSAPKCTQLAMQDNTNENNISMKSAFASAMLGLVVSSASVFGGPAAFADDSVQYDGFAEYAKENKMEQSDVGCFVKKCGDQTKALFSNPRGIKGVTCLGRCKGEQACATRCFAEFGSEDLNNWLSCTIEENECVKVPKNVDNSAENVGYKTAIRKFDPKSLIGTWYKTDGLNPNYDKFDCQTNTFTASAPDSSEVDMGIFFRVKRPEEAGGGFWENSLTEHMVVDSVLSDTAPGERTMHTEGKMYGLQFDENWYIIGESDGKGEVPPFVLVAYKGHTLQGNYEGSFVYSKEPKLPEAAIPAVREAAAKAGLNWDDYFRIDNTCPVGEPLNDSQAGTGTSTTDWIDLVVGEGGVIDWISPGWRGEYKK
mmetsp:Transcript_34741/g.84226  ORF Transcript_34741/g.84226 Transcript_34741/m.84226 type:complete len:390 (-) Transcript_34741:1950-3119(-)